MMHVLYINHASTIGGAETNLLNIMSVGHDRFRPVGVLLPRFGPLSTLVERAGVPVGYVSYHAWHWRNPLRYAHTISQLVGWIKRTKADVVHLNHQWLIEHVAIAAGLAGVPLLCHTRNLLDFSFVEANRRWLDMSAKLVCESCATTRRALELGLPASKLHCIYNGVEARRFSSGTGEAVNTRLSLGLGRGPVVGFSGRVVPEKGPEDLVRAIPLVRRRYPNAQFVLVGPADSDAYLAYLRNLACELADEQSARFVGYREDMDFVLPAIDVLVLPSRPSMPEGLPLSALEGLAAGCIVVATPNSGTAEAIRNGETGFLVQPEDPAALAEGICRALGLPAHERTAMRDAGRALVVAEFSLETQVTRLSSLYEAIVA